MDLFLLTLISFIAGFVTCIPLAIREIHKDHNLIERALQTAKDAQTLTKMSNKTSKGWEQLYRNSQAQLKTKS